MSMDSSDIIVILPTGPNAKYGNAKEWGQDTENGTIPGGARTARVRIVSTSVGGAPDGYVDLVSLDVTDAGVATPTVANAEPPDNAVNVGPVVNLRVTLQDRSTAVNTNAIKLVLDNNLLSPSIQK